MSNETGGPRRIEIAVIPAWCDSNEQVGEIQVQ
jgi:hypothetical protein